MKRSLALAVILASGFALSASAQTSSVPPSKIAIVAFQVAVAQTNEAQRAFADLQKKFEPKRAQIKAQSDEIDGLKKQLQVQGDALSDAERASRARTIDDKEKLLKRSADDAQADFQQEMQDLYSGVASKVYDVLASYAKQQGITLVLDVSQQQTPVLYAGDATNITKQIIDAYNLKSGVPAPPPGAPEPARPTAKPPVGR